jgi:HEAT repeat protein
MRLDTRIIIAVFSFALAVPSFAAEKLSTDELIQNLKDKDPKIREEAAKEVGARGEKLGLEALDEATLDKDPKVQFAVVEALGKIHHPQQVTYLSRAIRNTRGEAQKKAMSLLTEIYIPGHEHGRLKKLWFTVSGLFDPPEVTIVEPWMRVEPEAIDSVIFVLDQKDSENRIEAAATLGLLRAKSAVPRLAFYLRSPNTRMVRTTVRSMGYIGDRSAGPHLVPMLKHSDEDVVVDTARVLGQLQYAEALPELHKMFEYSDDDDYKERDFESKAESYLIELGPHAVAPVASYLKDSDKDFRIRLIDLMGNMHQPEAIPYLEPYLKDKEVEVAQAATHAVGKLRRMQQVTG